MDDEIKQYAISLENDIFINIRKAARAITNFYDRKFLLSEINSTQFIILLKISCLENKSLSKIARNLSVDRTTLLRNLTLLQKKELLKIKNLPDKRAKTCFLTEKGVEVKYAIHPVAGRMPGHMNVLLAEADIPYTDLVEMDEINPEMPQCDVALVVGANDVVNPAARIDRSSPIYGMPIIDADKARTVLAIKRSKNPGFAGIDNELYFSDRTWMLFGDAKNVVGELVKQLSGSGMH